MPTLPDVGRLGGGPLCGAGEGPGQDGRTRRAGRGPGVWEVFAVGRCAGFVVLAEVTARAARELRLADGGPVWATVEAPGWPAIGLNGIGPGLWRVLRRGPPLMPRMRRILPAAARTPRCGGGTRPQVNPSANPCDGSIRTGTQEMAETGRFAAPGAARKWRHPPQRSSTCPPSSSTPDCLQLRHRGGGIVDQEADHGTGGEVLVVLVAQGRTPRRCLPRGAGRRRSRPPVGWWSGRGLLGGMPPGPGTRLSWCLPNQCA